jgi:hypothetical protein
MTKHTKVVNGSPGGPRGVNSRGVSDRGIGTRGDSSPPGVHDAEKKWQQPWIGTTIHYAALAGLAIRAKALGLSPGIEWPTLPGGSKKGLGPGEIDLALDTGGTVHLYDLMSSNDRIKGKLIQLERYVQHYTGGVPNLDGNQVSGPVRVKVGTVLSEPQYREILAPIFFAVPFTRSMLYISFSLVPHVNGLIKYRYEVVSIEEDSRRKQEEFIRIFGFDPAPFLRRVIVYFPGEFQVPIPSDAKARVLEAAAKGAKVSGAIVAGVVAWKVGKLILVSLVASPVAGAASLAF